MKDPKAIVLGLDGATFDLIEPWVEEEKLPNFKELMENGCWGEMRTTIPPLTCPAWPTMFTGVNPGKHGVFDFMETKDREELTLTGQFSLETRPFWEILGAFGKKVGVAFVPVTYPPEKVNGFMISGPPSPDHFGPTYPDELREEMEREIGELNVDHSATESKKNYWESYFEGLSKEFNLKKKIFRFLLEKNLDFLFFVFFFTDTVQHYYWRYIEDGDSEFSNYIFKAYKKVDEFLGELSEYESNIFIVSDHGFGPQERMINLNNYLHEKGYLSFKRNPKSLLKRLLFKLGITPHKMKKIAKKIGFENPEEGVNKEKRNEILNTFFLSYDDVDWNETFAYSKGHYNQIHIDKDNTNEKNVENLIRDLENIKDSDGKKIVDKIYKTQEIYDGPHTNKGPNLVLKLENYSITSYPFLSSENQLITKHIRNTSGGHRENAIFLANGPDIRKSKGKIEPIRITDIAPTVLHMYLSSIPSYLDENPLKKIFRKNSGLRNKKIEYIDSEKLRIKNKLKKIDP